MIWSPLPLTSVFVRYCHNESEKTQMTISQANLFKSTKQQLVVNLIGCILAAYATFYPNYVFADSNVAGIEIEIIGEPIASDFAGDPVQDFLTGADTNNQDDIWARIKDGYSMPDIESPYTSNHETWYAARPDYINRMMERGQRYLFHIVEEVQKRGMPTEIALLPMIESAFNPQAYSRSRASGIWQFIPSTGKSFGLQQNWWIDNRRDVTAATTAALDYLQKLHGMFGTWDLALAAYNAGEGTVQRAIDKNRRQGLPTDYQSLNLPPETRNYVPKLQAIKNIVTDPEKFGLDLHSIPNRPYFAYVRTPKQIDAKLAAQLAEISDDEFASLNPSYNRPVITSTGEKHQLLLPVWAAERFAENLSNYDKPLTNWQTYHAKRGERMDNIANKFGIKVSQLRDVNGLSAAKKVRYSRAILVPANYSEQQTSDDAKTIHTADMSNNSISDTDQTASKIGRVISHKVKKGDTLSGLADRYGSNSKALMRVNQLKSSHLKVGQILKINDVDIKKTSVKKARHKGSSRKIINNNSRKKSIKSRKKSSGYISAGSHIRLK